LVAKLVNRRGDHFTFLNIYEKFRDASDQKAFARKYGIRLDVLNSATRLVDYYYYRIISASRAPPMERTNDVDVKQRLLEALKMSHKHLIAKKMTTTYPRKQVTGQINKESAVYYHYNRKELANKTFIYDELISINGNWEYSVVTII
jgi:pre-mRNA-splicing factor ATP-dependent RNA helicase DHX15/PRP43